MLLVADSGKEDILKFEEMNIDPLIERAVSDLGYEEATPIQSRAIPEALAGKDILGQAQTGTGKTAAFAIPVLQHIDPSDKHIQAIVICPTRELALQVAGEFRKLAKYMHDVKLLPVYGGQDIVKQIKSLRQGVQIIVGTPGRIMDHMRRKTAKFDHVTQVVLDEADEMLDMGFRDDIETILSEVPDERQTMLFSATMPKPIRELAGKFQHNAENIQIAKKELTVENIDQYYFEVRRDRKPEVLSRVLDVYNPELTVIFCNTKMETQEVANELQERGYFAEGLHGDLKQAQRDLVMQNFRSGRTEILVATDVAARGIDVSGVDLVVNYDLPQDDEYYVHRIGRTGRAGKSGLAVSFVTGREIIKLKEIMRYCHTKILLKPVPTLDDVTNTRVNYIFDKIASCIEEEDLSKMSELIEDKVNENDYTTLDVAGAFLKLYLDSKMGNSTDSGEDDSDYSINEDDYSDGNVRLFINIGKKDHVRPGDILGAIAGESGISGKLVGEIKMHDEFTFVEVPAEYGNAVLQAMKHAKIKGKKINIERARKAERTPKRERPSHERAERKNKRRK